MVIHFMVPKKAEVLGSSLTITLYQKNFHVLGHEKELGPQVRARIENILSVLFNNLSF